MNEHPDIADLSAKELSDAVSVHLESCDVCAQIHADIQLLDVDLKELNLKTVIPASVDQQVYAEIAERSKTIRKSIFRKNLIASVSAIAAVLILSITVVTNLKVNKPLVADINGDGEVNVLDSLMLAQQIDSNQVELKNDLNDDGQINLEDVEIVQNAVVSLDGRLP